MTRNRAKLPTHDFSQTNYTAKNIWNVSEHIGAICCTIVYGMLFWSVIIFVILGALSCVMYLYAKYTGTKIQTHFLPFAGKLMAFSLFCGSLTFLGMYFSKKFGVQDEYRIALKIIVVLGLLSYFLKDYKTKKQKW